MLNCNLGELPMKYLGIPVSDSHLAMGAFSPIIQKMGKRLDPWKRASTSLLVVGKS